MLRPQSHSATVEPVIATQVNPRLRQTLSKRLGTVSVSDMERLSWLYWLLRTRQPRRVLMSGPDDAAVLLMTAAAISAGRAGRIHLPDRQSQRRSLSVLADAGLEWVVSCRSGLEQAVDQTIFDAVVVQGRQWADQVQAATRHLAAGALIIGLDDPVARNQTNAACTELLRAEPGLESLMLSPVAMPVITMIWRGH